MPIILYLSKQHDSMIPVISFCMHVVQHGSHNAKSNAAT